MSLPHWGVPLLAYRDLARSCEIWSICFKFPQNSHVFVWVKKKGGGWNSCFACHKPTWIANLRTGAWGSSLPRCLEPYSLEPNLAWYDDHNGFQTESVECGTKWLHIGRLTWNLKITQLKRNIIFQTIIFRFHVNLPGCVFRSSNHGRKRVIFHSSLSFNIISL